MLKRMVLITAGLVLVAALGAILFSALEPGDRCEICYRPRHEGTYYRIHLADSGSVDVCCPRCGLRFQEDREDVVGAEVTDFYTHESVPANEAFYVENSSIHPCSHSPVQEDRSGTQYEVAWDRCLPSLIAFQSRAEARAFQQQNGGSIRTYSQLFP